MLRRTILLLAVAVFSASCTAAPSARDADLRALAHLKTEVWPDLYRRQDAPGLENFLAEDFILIDNDGAVTTRAEVVPWLEQNRWRGADDFRYEIDAILFQGDDVALVHGRGVSTQGAGDEACLQSYGSANLFRRIEGRWRPSFSQVSEASCAPLSEGGAANETPL